MTAKITIASLGRLRPNPFNVNVVSAELEAKLDASIRRFGLFKPIVVREAEPIDGTDFEIVGGEHRWAAARRVGLTEVPIFNLGNVSDERAKEIMLVDNQRYGSDDVIALAELMKGMDASLDDFNSFLPLSTANLNDIFSATTIALDDIELPDLESEIDAIPEPKATKTPRTHTVMKFKVPVKDAERVAEVIAKIEKRHGYTGSDQMTNAGDALVHLIFDRGDDE